MTTQFVFLVLVIAAAVLVLVEVLREVRHDGPSGHAPPRSHVEDPRFRSPGAWS